MPKFSITIEGEYYKEGSSDPWRDGAYSAEVTAESRAEAIIETLEGLGDHGRVASEGGDLDWTLFDDERELVFRVIRLDADEDWREAER